MRRAMVLMLGVALCVASPALAVAAEKAPTPASWKPTRNAIGQPDLSGYWSNATLTPLTRNSRISNKATLTAEEAKGFESIWAKALADSDAPTDPDVSTETVQASNLASKLVEIRPDFIAAGGDTGGYNTFWIDPGTHLVEINGQYRTSILTTLNGLPMPRKPAAPVPKGFGQYRDIYDSYENRSLGERCITGFGRNNGPPMLPNGYYNNNYQIMQTPDSVVIEVEMIHDARIIRLSDKHGPDGPRRWMGDSIGRWEGDVLVVETTNFPRAQAFHGSWQTLKVTERFSRAAEDRLLYRFTVEDPALWDRPWGGEYEFAKAPREIEEYACHPNDQTVQGSLEGSRYEEAHPKQNSGTGTQFAP